MCDKITCLVLFLCVKRRGLCISPLVALSPRAASIAFFALSLAISLSSPQSLSQFSPCTPHTLRVLPVKHPLPVPPFDPPVVSCTSRCTIRNRRSYSPCTMGIGGIFRHNRQLPILNHATVRIPNRLDAVRCRFLQRFTLVHSAALAAHPVRARVEQISEATRRLPQPSAGRSPRPLPFLIPVSQPFCSQYISLYMTLHISFQKKHK